MASTTGTLGRDAPTVKDGGVSERGTRSERRRVGAYYTPPVLVDLLVREVLVRAFDGRTEPPLVIDPACGDGRLLEAAGRAITERYGVDPSPYLVGVELDPATAADTAGRIGCAVLCGDARTLLNSAEHAHRYDVLIGNPPYLSQLSTSTARGGRSALGGGPYADVAAEFLSLSTKVVRAIDGRIGLVLPMSILATRDVAPIRTRVEQDAGIELCWWANESMFDANVRTCVLGLVTGRAPAEVRRLFGADVRAIGSVSAPRPGSSESWGWLVADAAGIPPVDLEASDGVLANIAGCTADFRDQYYGLVDAVADGADGPPLVTSGLIDAAQCYWGSRSTRFAKQRFEAPRVDLARLTPALQTWARTRLVPKVLVATQTKVIEAVVDEQGEWLPSVPVISVVPHDPADVWRVAALLTSPVASAWIVTQRVGTGLSAHAIRVTASDLARLPLPSDASAWQEAASALQRGDVLDCGRRVLDAYGFSQRDDLYRWWAERVSGSTVQSG